MASFFCNVNCNYAFCKRGARGQKGEGRSFASCSMVSVSMVCHVLAGKGSERSADLRVLLWSPAGLAAQQNQAGAGLSIPAEQC